MSKKITISDIAKEARVSKTTISRYLNGHYDFMSVETRERIEKIIKENDYVPSTIARTLKSKKSGMIGVVVSNLHHQLGAQTVTGINDICRENGYITIVQSSNDDPEMEEKAIQICLNQAVEGIIIIPCDNKIDRYVKICEKGIPVVLCTRKISGWPYSSVYVRHDLLIKDMLVHLRDQGFEKARFFVDVKNFSKQWMADSFSQGAKELFGMSSDEAIRWVGRNGRDIEQEINTFLREYPSKRKAIMAVNTHILFLTLRELGARKIQIPKDIGVCGYDAIGWSELVNPGVTAIKQPLDRIGILAAETMMDILRRDSENSQKIALDGQLHLRNSTKLK